MCNVVSEGADYLFIKVEKWMAPVTGVLQPSVWDRSEPQMACSGPHGVSARRVGRSPPIYCQPYAGCSYADKVKETWNQKHLNQGPLFLSHRRYYSLVWLVHAAPYGFVCHNTHSQTWWVNTSTFYNELFWVLVKAAYCSSRGGEDKSSVPLQPQRADGLKPDGGQSGGD